MEFHLTYQGPLYATQRDPVGGQKDARATHKHQIRKKFHAQLKQLWATNRFLRETKISPLLGLVHFKSDVEPMAEVLAHRYSKFGYRFVPLVRQDVSLLCSIDVLFLRRDAPGAVIKSGDIDNRLKTLFDALRLPNNVNELVGNESPSAGEDPFFCLAEDDSLISKVTVDTDMLLDPLEGEAADMAFVRLILTVRVRPYDVNTFTVGFA